MTKLFASLALCAGMLAAPVFAESDVTATLVKKLTASRDFTLKVAEAMPADDYSFKLTPAQMSFGEQLTHLSGSLSYFTSVFTGQKPPKAKPASNSKADVDAFVKAQYDQAIAVVSKLTPDQLAKVYDGEEGKETGLEQLMGMLDHATHHRASAEMYLRAKGIKPPEYMN